MSNPRRKAFVRRPSPKRRRAAAVLFMGGFDMRTVGRLLRIRYVDVQAALRKTLALAWLLLGLAAAPAHAQITIPNTFVNGTPADATQVNVNFAAVGSNALNRTGGTMSGTLTSQAITPATDATYALGDATHRYTTGNFSGLVGTGQLGLIGGVGFGASAAGKATVAYDTGLARLTASLNAGTYLPIELGWTIVTSTATGTLNDFAPGLAGDTVIRMNNATVADITGLSGGFPGQRVIILALNAPVGTKHQDGGSAAPSRIVNFFPTETFTKGSGFGVFEYIYDGTSLRWRLTHHDQGGPIDYGPSSTINGFSAFTTKSIQYQVIGSRVYVDVNLQGASNATTVNFSLPYAPTISPNFALGFTEDNTVVGTATGVCVTAGSTVNCFLDNSQGLWTAAGTKAVAGQFSYPVS